MFIGFLRFPVCIRLIDCLKELSQLSHQLSQLLNILLCFLNGCIEWRVGIGGCEDTPLAPKLKAGVLQSSNDFLVFFCKDWDMSTTFMFVVIFLIVTDGGGSLVVSYT
jgi:hypothetical protein